MESKSYAFWTGLFIVTLAIVLLLMVFWLSGDTKEYKPYILVSRSSVAGLNESAPVRLRGVQVGKVDGVQFDSKDPSAILIRVSVHKDAPITKGTYAQLSFQGLTGLSGIELSDDGNNAEPLETSPDDPARIVVKPSLMESVTNSGQIFIQRLNDLSARLLEVINEDSATHLQKPLSSWINLQRLWRLFLKKLNLQVKNYLCWLGNWMRYCKKSSIRSKALESSPNITMNGSTG